MKYSLPDRVLNRELGKGSRYSKIRGIYGDKQFVNDLDIVNELNGHTGCVNALSWSRSGRLLASGSDDRMVNIYSYLPDNSTKQFELSTTIATGHRMNIFSVKFMPHSNDRTIVTAAGDGQIRVFDIERASFTTGSRQILSAGSANAKVFRSHSGAVKRIVTEASPFYFLSCAEDGDVRQWDIRQPESAYPLSDRYQSVGNAPPPLISYRNYNVSLYTISCSPSQPHYIALGGTHLHCFLHDRRMIGRDKLRECGSLPPLSHNSDHDVLRAATRCVRTFAPHGQERMDRSDPKSLTACKISDANPNDLIASWNSDHIYSFNMLNSDDSSHAKAPSGLSKGMGSGRSKQQRDHHLKRKREASQGLSQRHMSNGDRLEIPVSAEVVAESHLSVSTALRISPVAPNEIRNDDSAFRRRPELPSSSTTADAGDDIDESQDEHGPSDSLAAVSPRQARPDRCLLRAWTGSAHDKNDENDEDLDDTEDDDTNDNYSHDGDSGADEDEHGRTGSAIDKSDEDDDGYESSLENSSDNDESTYLKPPFPCATHSRVYRGHCNVQTTKDVNFFGLQDEYVVSGSDCGNLFIWDRKTAQLLNILEGDDEVVNVIQGHPYEPMLAVSGIDHTVKIFSPDARERKNARRGIGIEENDHRTFTSIRRRRQIFTPSAAPAHHDTRNHMESSDSSDSENGSIEESLTQEFERITTYPNPSTSASYVRELRRRTNLNANAKDDENRHPLPSRRRMHDEYRIVSQNDMEGRRSEWDESALSRSMMAMMAQRRFGSRLTDAELEAFAGFHAQTDGDECTLM